MLIQSLSSYDFLYTVLSNSNKSDNFCCSTLQLKLMSNYEEKYKKALKSIEEIIKANKQIKDELDALRTMRQADLDSFTNIQKEEFKKAYDALLKEKNTLVITLQTFELENQKLKYTISELENQVALYRNQKFHRNEERDTLFSNQRLEASPSDHPSPRKSDQRDPTALLREKQAEFHRTIQNYQEHHSNLLRNNKRLEERISELQNKLTNTDKNWRVKYEAKELEVIDIKALTRQEFTEQVSILRKQNSALKLANNDLVLRLENVEKNGHFGKSLQTFDWEADLVREMIAVKANLEPLRQQINELQELNIYQREQSVRERTNLHTRVLELEAEVERQQETIRAMERKVVEAHQDRSNLEQKAHQLKKFEEENQLLNGKIIVMESREIALRNRTGEELEERVLEFENRIELLLNNKEGLRELREVGIHQLLALKAYIMELDSRLKELILSNGYLLKKYKSYKEKYQASLKEHKQYGLTINTLKMKILGYDKLVLKLQGELERMVRVNQTELQIITNPKALQQSNQSEIYKKKFQLMKQKLEIQEKYKEQEMETFKLNYQTRIMELTIKVEQVKSLRETIELYRTKNQELQGLLSKKQTEIFESKILTNSKVNPLPEDMTNTRQTKDIISNLHASLKQNDETIFRLQTQLRNKEDTYKRSVTKLEREIEDLKQDHVRELSKREMDYSINLDQEVKKYKLKISDLQHNQHLQAITHKDEHHKKTEEVDSKVRKLESRLQEAETKREEEVFNRRRIEKTILDLTHDKEELQRTINDLQLRLTHFKSQEKDYNDLKSRLSQGAKQESKESYLDYELQSKDTIIKRLNAQILDMKSSLGGLGEKDITISAQKNEIFYLKKQIEELHDTINKYNNQFVFLKGTLDTNKISINTEFSTLIDEKENAIGRLRRDLTAKQSKIRDFEEEISKLEQSVRKYKRDLTEIDRLREEVNTLGNSLQEKDRTLEKLRFTESSYDEQIQRLSKQLTYVKESYQHQNYELLEKDDQISKLNLEINSVGIKSREQIQSKYSEQLLQKERQCNRLNSELLNLKSTLAMAEEDRNYHEQNYKRANNDIFTLRTQVNQLQEDQDQISNQLYYKTQEVNKLQYSLDNYKEQNDQFNLKSQETYRMRTQIFSLKSDISNLQEEIFNRQAANARLANQISYVRNQYAELEEELDVKQEYLTKLTYEYNTLKANYEQAEVIVDDKDKIAAKLNNELNSMRNKYRDLEEEMEEREQAFSMLSQELSKLKTNLTYYEEEIDERNTQIARLNNEKEVLKAEIMRLNEVISEKNQEVNRSKQEVFSMRLQAGERDYEEKMRVDQELYTLRSKITTLEHEIEDRDSEIRRLNIDIDAVRHQPVSQSATSEEEVQELRNELGKRQRQMINMRYDLQDRQYQLETAINNANMLKNTVSDYQQRLITQREEFQVALKEYVQRDRRWQEQVLSLREELENMSYQQQREVPKAQSFSATYTEQEMSALREDIVLKQREFNNLKYELEDKQFILSSLESKTKMQETLLQQIQEQYNEDRQRYQAQIKQYSTQERLFQINIDQMQEHYEQQIARMEYEKALEKTRASANLVNINQAPSSASAYDQAALLKPYIEEIDRLSLNTQELEDEIQTYKLKIADMENKRVSQLAAMVSTKKHLNSEEQIDEPPHKQNIVVTTQQQQQQVTELYQYQQGEVHQIVRQIQINQESSLHAEETHQEREESASSENEVEEIVEVDKQHEANIKGSLIQQLQKEQSISEGSQVRGGQITIKIPNPGQYMSSNIAPPQPIPIYNQKIIQVQPQFITGPNGQQIRVMQQVPQQVYILPQQPAPYPIPQNVIVQGSTSHSGVYQQAVPQPISRQVQYINIATPVNTQPYRSLP